MSMKKDFIEHVVEAVPYRDERRASVARTLKQVFKKLDIPEPKSGQYRQGVGHFGQVFFNSAGIVLRVVHNEKAALYRHRHLMRPIGSVMLADIVRLDFQYAGKTNISGEEIKVMSKAFWDADLDVGDLRPANSCRLNIAAVDFPKGVPIIFDASTIRRFRRKVRNISEQINDAQDNLRVIDMRPINDEVPDEQDRAFESLRENFTRVFEHGKDNSSAAKKFWDAVKDAKNTGLITPSWRKKWILDHAISVNKTSRSYAKSLAAHNPELFQIN